MSFYSKINVCKLIKVSRRNKRPKVSEGSQFHHPPQVPSWTAHQLPKKRAVKEVNEVIGDTLINCFNWNGKIKRTVVDFSKILIIKKLKVKKVPE